MIFTGLDLIKKRNFYTQSKNFGVIVNFSLDNASEKYEFGITGTNNISFICESGRITWNNLFIDSYLPYYNYSAFIDITESNINYSNNENNIFYGLEKETGAFEYFYFKRNKTEINADFDFYLSGDNKPNYEITNYGLLLNTKQNVITGKFFNYGDGKIRIFDSNSQGLQNLNYIFNKDEFQNGQYLDFFYSGNISNFNFNEPIITTFYTNYGQTQINFKIINATSLEKSILLNQNSALRFNQNNVINRELSWINYSGDISTNNFNTELYFELSYVDGSGEFLSNDFAKSAYFSDFANGYIFESGMITGMKSILTGNNYITGFYEVTFSRFKWATGITTGYFSGAGYGIATGDNYSGLSYGIFTGYLTGVIYDGSGSFVFDNVLGSGFLVNEAYSILYTGYKNATGYINISGIINDSPIFIGNNDTPILKGLQYNNETGLVYYLNTNPEHKVKASYDDNLIKLEANISGTQGNLISISDYACSISKLFSYTPFLLGGEDIGSTGNIVYSNSLFTGIVSCSSMNSGYYVDSVTGIKEGTFRYIRTFSGSWDLLTGLSNANLVPIKKKSDIISGIATVSPNSNMFFEIRHYNSYLNIEKANFVVSGKYILNPINKLIIQ